MLRLRTIAAVLLLAVVAAAAILLVPGRRDATRPASASQEPCALPTASLAMARPPHGIWMGGDAALSLPVAGGRSLWLFGDSLLRRPDGGWALVRNAGILDAGADGAQVLCPANAPAEFFRLPGGASPSERWLWPLHGIARGTDAWILLAEMRRTGPGPWSFAFVRTWVAKVSTTGWRVLRLSAVRAPAGILWGAWVMERAGRLYLFGIEDRPQDKGVVIARARGRTPASGWDFWNGRRWASRAVPAAVARPVGAQLSVVAVRGGLALLTQVGLRAAPRLQVFRARRIEGPWSGPQTLYDGFASEGIVTYNMAAHPEYPGRGLLVTYCRASTDFEDFPTQPDRFRPGFLRVRRACLALP